ncbi:MAG: (Fe-S)-binding protein [bacterium]|nr:(Fe-S)-binding protein [bacterium]
MGKVLTAVAREQCIGCLSCMFACSRTWHKALTETKSAMRVRSYTGNDGAFSLRICRACENPDCVAACKTGALTQNKSGVLKLDSEKCTFCKECVEACLINALQWDSEKQLPLPCSHCGICARYCPNEVLTLLERKEVAHVDEDSGD